MPQTRVLIVEDDPDDARLIVTRLHRGGLDLAADIVTTAEQFRAALDAHPPDLVISDYNLPAFTAEEALRTLRENGGDAPFILVSGQVGEEIAAAMMKAGASDFVLKDRASRLVPAVQRELREAGERRQRRAAEAALRDSEQRFRLLAEHAIDIIFRFRLRPDRGLEYISPAITSITGHEPAEVYANPALLAAIIDDEDREAFTGSWLRPRRAPQILRAHHPDGRRLWIEQRAILITDADGEPVAVEGTLRDVTEQQRLDHELRQAERLDSLGHLAGGIAHDFNNLLAIITAYATDITEALGESHPCHPDIVRISHAAERAAALTRQLLIFSRLEPSQPEVLDLNQVVADTEQLLQRTIGEDITFTTDLDPDLPPVTIDRSKLEQVIVNLVVNARAAMSDGGRLTVTTRHLLPPLPGRPAAAGGAGVAPAPGTVSLTVTDTGCGMPTEVVARAFEPFFTTKGPGNGTGLGLATAYGVVTQAGGDIHIDSVPGRGTTITVLLPSSDPPATAAGAADDGPGTVEEAGGHILVVEDDGDVRDIVVRILTRAGYRVTAPASAAAAIDLCADPAFTVDALLTDVIMPDIAGPQLAVAARLLRPQLPVLYMSGYTAGNLPGGRTLTDDPLLRKPFTAAELLQQLQQALRRTRSLS
ncbi:response regulator [Dactylosporangium aurantiacum]|uniref:histidine kinase n=1 Tax=Dactylosporangium aurantiacum TaxID=35754 RepID=A0A9Q9IB85_9ACTN|nr:hybrid sensor histidine kinase/response regulator [Dactylosporangium aurantiacum]MDG6103586.1 response regulator [Dactylosporangium aurantiacum]UWZ51921.1 response regulator [Dactylosporangium aurantiacum]